MTKRLMMLWAMLLFLAGIAGAQVHQHNTVTVKVIDGAKNPELIPDSVVYRQVLVADFQPVAQATRLYGIGLSEKEIIQVTVLLAEFHSAHNAWLERWNVAANAANNAGTTFSPEPFLQQLEDLMQNIMTAIRSIPRAGPKIDRFMQKQKANIQIHEGVAQ